MPVYEGWMLKSNIFVSDFLSSYRSTSAVGCLFTFHAIALCYSHFHHTPSHRRPLAPSVPYLFGYIQVITKSALTSIDERKLYLQRFGHISVPKRLTSSHIYWFKYCLTLGYFVHVWAIVTYNLNRNWYHFVINYFCCLWTSD